MLMPLPSHPTHPGADVSDLQAAVKPLTDLGSSLTGLPAAVQVRQHR